MRSLSFNRNHHDRIIVRKPNGSNSEAIAIAAGLLNSEEKRTATDSDSSETGEIDNSNMTSSDGTMKFSNTDQSDAYIVVPAVNASTRL